MQTVALCTRKAVSKRTQMLITKKKGKSIDFDFVYLIQELYGNVVIVSFTP